MRKEEYTWILYTTDKSHGWYIVIQYYCVCIVHHVFVFAYLRIIHRREERREEDTWILYTADKSQFDELSELREQNL